MVHRVFDFFRRQSRNFKVLIVQGIVVGGVFRALTRQYTNLYIVSLGAAKSS